MLSNYSIPRNIFSPFIHAELKSLAETAKACTDQGWCKGYAGNFSYFDKSRGVLWSSPSMVDKGKLNAKSFIATRPNFLASKGPNGATSSKFFDRKHDLYTAPSGEISIHSGIYESRQEARCVIHAHAPFTILLSQFLDSINLSGWEVIKHFKCRDLNEETDIPIFDNPLREAMEPWARTLKTSIGNQRCPAIILRGHGAYAWAESPALAMAYFESLELMCQHIVQAIQLELRKPMQEMADPYPTNLLRKYGIPYSQK